MAAGLLGCATSPAPVAAPPAKRDFSNNFGFPLAFSAAKMDPTADPRRDFMRYAGGRWLDAAQLPADKLQASGYLVMAKAVEDQLRGLLEEAARTSGSAPKGSPRQQVGDFYTSALDEQRLTALGVQPLQPELDRLNDVQSPTALAKALAHAQLVSSDILLVAVSVAPDPRDRTRNTVYVGDAELGLGLDNYLKPEMQPIRDGYVKLIADFLVLGGKQPAEARATAAMVLEIETRVARKKLTPVEQRDPSKRFVPMRYGDLKVLLSNIDVDAFFAASGLPAVPEAIVVEANALRERNAILGEYSLADRRAYLQCELLRKMHGYLTPAFRGPKQAFANVVYGKYELPSRTEEVGKSVPGLLGHPLSQLYVAKYLSPENKRAAEELVGRVKAEFRARLEGNTWLSPATKAEALNKLGKTEILVGYPAQWMDYSSVDIRPDDFLGNAMRISEFRARRELAKYGKPVTTDHFAMAGVTLPIDINAAYNSGTNGIEIPAAFLQPPFYDANADAAVNYCTLGAVIGHELTHGFDSSGRLYDATGNVRDWWTPVDAQHFQAETQKLVRQANAFEPLPGLRLNGALEVTENLADVGGVSLAYGALRGYLRGQPQANRSVDGFTPTQRCFLAWAQLWADKTNEGAMRQTIPTDGHPPGIYRMTAPAQHDKAFYEAFDIRPGDPMWLDVPARVAIW